MTLYMLDTNVVSALMRDPRGNIAKRIAEVGADAIAVSIVVAAELRYGCSKKGSAILTERVETILGSVDIIAFDRPADVEYGDIRAALEANGTPIGPNDLLIAAHARSLGAVLVTANTGEFERVPGLQVENWVS